MGDEMKAWRGVRALGLAVAASALVAACGPSMAPTVQAVPVVTISTEQLVGKWGLASYRVEQDLDRTKSEAKSACGNPYVITAGPTGGVMMHLADQAVAEEVVLKTASDGRVYIGPQGKPGDKRDRQVVTFAEGVMVTQWVDPSVATRYGTMVFVRCSA